MIWQMGMFYFIAVVVKGRGVILAPKGHWQSLETALFVMAGDGGRRSCSVSHSAQGGPIAEEYPPPALTVPLLRNPASEAFIM